MAAQEYNKFILDYVKSKTSDYALMLSSPWGTGKSHYIQTELIPFLENQNIRTIVVSLYGLNTIEEVCKALYLEIRFAKLQKVRRCSKNKEKVNAAIIVGKAVVKGIASYFGIDLKIDNKDLENLFDSVDLTDKLLIFEDLERSGVDPVTILGFVNNLTEGDKAKVLLVANEKEIVKNLSSNPDGNSESEYYLRYREKTVRDVIGFKCDLVGSMRSIVSNLCSEEAGSLLKPINNDHFIEEAIRVTDCFKAVNLRAFIYSIQKTVDLLRGFNSPDAGYIQAICLGIFAFALRRASGNDDADQNSISSQGFGTEEFPLYDSARSYILFQQSPTPEQLNQEQSEFLLRKDIFKKDQTLKAATDVIRGFSIHSESELEKAIEDIASLLKKNEPKPSVPIGSYGTLASYFVFVKDCLHNKQLIESCIDSLISNLSRFSRNERSDLIKTWHISAGFSFDSSEQKKEFLDILGRVQEADRLLNEKTDACPSELHKFLRFAESGLDTRGKAGLLENIDISSFAKELSRLNADDLQKVRLAFRDKYCLFNNASEYLFNDLTKLRELKGHIDEVLKVEDSEFPDLIIKKQFQYLSDTLKMVINNLKRTS